MMTRILGDTIGPALELVVNACHNAFKTYQ
jgi:hypothetical protein